MSYADLTVIGAGLAGLTAAVLAARAGLSVTLWTGREAGGRARTDLVDGFRLNHGAKALYDAGVAARTWRELGVDLSGGAPSFTFWAAHQERRTRLPVDAMSLARSGLLGVVDKARFAGILTRMGSLADSLDAEVTWGAWRREQAADGTTLAALLDALARLSTFIEDPGPVRASVLMRQMGLSGGGITYLDGGWQRIVDQLLALAVESGADVITENALGVERADGGFRVRGRDVEIRSDAVCVAAGARATSKLLDLPLPELTPVRACALDLGLSAVPDAAVPFVLDLDTPRYLSVHSLVADLAAPGGHVLHAIGYGEHTRESLEDFVERWQPGFREHVVAARFRPAMVVQQRAPRVDAPPVPVQLAPGLFQVGDHVGEGCLSDAAVQSALDLVALLQVPAARRHAG